MHVAPTALRTADKKQAQEGTRAAEDLEQTTYDLAERVLAEGQDTDEPEKLAGRVWLLIESKEAEEDTPFAEEKIAVVEEVMPSEAEEVVTAEELPECEMAEDESPAPSKTRTPAKLKDSPPPAPKRAFQERPPRSVGPSQALGTTLQQPEGEPVHLECQKELTDERWDAKTYREAKKALGQESTAPRDTFTSRPKERAPLKSAPSQLPSQKVHHELASSELVSRPETFEQKENVKPTPKAETITEENERPASTETLKATDRANDVVALKRTAEPKEIEKESVELKEPVKLKKEPKNAKEQPYSTYEPRHLGKALNWILGRSPNEDESSKSEGEEVEETQNGPRHLGKLVLHFVEEARDWWSRDGSLEERDRIDPDEALPFKPIEDLDIPITVDDQMVLFAVILAMIARIDRVADAKLQKEIEKAINKREAAQWLEGNVKNMRELARKQEIFQYLGIVGMAVPLAMPKLVPPLLSGRVIPKINMTDPLQRDEMKRQILSMSQQFPQMIQMGSHTAQSEAQPAIEGFRARMDLANKGVESKAGTAHQLRQTADECSRVAQSLVESWGRPVAVSAA